MKAKRYTYQDLLTLPQWTKKRKEIFKRDGHACQSCGARRELTIHHRQYQYDEKLNDFIKPWNYENKYLITLCVSCHEAGHQLYKIPVKFI